MLFQTALKAFQSSIGQWTTTNVHWFSFLPHTIICLNRKKEREIMKVCNTDEETFRMQEPNNCGAQPYHLRFSSNASEDLVDSNPVVQLHLHEPGHWLSFFVPFTHIRGWPPRTISRKLPALKKSVQRGSRSVDMRETCPNYLNLFRKTGESD